MTGRTGHGDVWRRRGLPSSTGRYLGTAMWVTHFLTERTTDPPPGSANCIDMKGDTMHAVNAADVVVVVELQDPRLPPRRSLAVTVPPSTGSLAKAWSEVAGEDHLARQLDGHGASVASMGPEFNRPVPPHQGQRAERGYSGWNQSPSRRQRRTNLGPGLATSSLAAICRLHASTIVVDRSVRSLLRQRHGRLPSASTTGWICSADRQYSSSPR